MIRFPDKNNLNNKCNRQKENSSIFRVENPETSFQIAELLSSMVPFHKNKQLIFLGIGSDRSTGDSLGPLCGSLLENLGHSQIIIMGTLEQPVHALNLRENIKLIEECYHNSFILAVDAALGSVKSVGQIKIEPGPLLPGLAVNKTLPAVGDLHITGTVNISGCLEYLVLQNTRLSLVMNLARTITAGIHMALRKDYSFSSTSLPGFMDVP